MNNLIDLEKKINSELGTKINSTKIKHNQIYAEIDKEDLIDVTLFLKTNKNTKFKQLIDITVVDYPEKPLRFKIVYLFLTSPDKNIFTDNTNSEIRFSFFKVSKSILPAGNLFNSDVRI